MEDFVDHYVILGLPSGEEGAKLSRAEVSKAYRLKALELHPDKCRDDVNAHEKFQRLKKSHDILRDEKARKSFDDFLRVKHQQQLRRSRIDSKRRKMMSDLEERERSAFAPNANAEEERTKQKLDEEVAQIRAKYAKKSSDNLSDLLRRAAQPKFPTAETSSEAEWRLRNIARYNFQAFEDQVLQRLQKAAEIQKRRNPGTK